MTESQSSENLTEETAEPSRPLPELTPWNQSYWLGGSVGELRIQRCPECSQYQHPPMVQCPRCPNASLEYPAVSGRGHVYTFSVLRYPYRAGLRLPIVMALIELIEQEGLHVGATIVDCAPEDVRIGREVIVDFEPAGQGIYVPVFHLAGP